MKRNKFMTYGIYTLFIIALSAAFCLLQGFVGTLVGMLISAVLAVVFYHEHYSFSVLNTVLFLVILTLFLSPGQMLYAGVPIVLLALSLHFGMKKKLGLYPLMLICTALFLAEFLVGMGLLSFASDNQVTLSSMMLDIGRQMQAMLLAQNPDVAMKTQIESAIQTTVDMFIQLAPAVFLIFSTIEAYILIVIYKALLEKRKTDVSHLVTFSQMQAEKTTAVIFLILLLLLTALPHGMFRSAAINVFVILCFIFWALGLSVFDAKLQMNGTKKGKRIFLLLILGLGSTMLLMAPTLFLVGYGLLDSFFDFRHLRKGNSEQA